VLTQPGTDSGGRRVVGDIVPFVGIGFTVRELFGTILVPNVTVKFGANCGVIAAQVGEDGVFPFCFRILQQGDETAAFVGEIFGKAGKLKEGWIDVDGTYRPGAGGVDGNEKVAGICSKVGFRMFLETFGDAFRAMA